MIHLTRCDGTEVFLNHELIELIEEAPYTVLTLTTGRSYLVKDSAAVVVEKIVAFKAGLLRRAAGNPTGGGCPVPADGSDPT